MLAALASSPSVGGGASSVQLDAALLRKAPRVGDLGPYCCAAAAPSRLRGWGAIAHHSAPRRERGRVQRKSSPRNGAVRALGDSNGAPSPSDESPGKAASGASPASKSASDAQSAIARARAYAQARREAASGAQAQALSSPRASASAGAPTPPGAKSPSISENGTGSSETSTSGNGSDGSGPRSGEGTLLSSNSGSNVISIALMESSSVYRRQQDQMLAAISEARANRAESAAPPAPTSGPRPAGAPPPGTAPPGAEASKPKGLVEVEIVTRDGVIKKQLSRSEVNAMADRGSSSSKPRAASVSQASNEAATNQQGNSSSRAPGRGASRPSPELKLSASDFAGLSFSDDSNRSARATPAGLYAPADMPPPGQLPQVEIITRDAGPGAGGQGAGEDVYKPKVATWGVFPRPRDISRKYGGGRNIQPGQALETEEDKKAREERTRKLLEEYNRIAGFTMDPAVKAECEKALAAGAALMDQGRLAEAAKQFEVVTSKAAFKHELHGTAGIQLAMCLDSMARNQEAKVMYEKLAAHPNSSVKRKAQQMLFGFRAAETLKLSGGSDWDAAWYRPYFDSVSKKSLYNTTYKAENSEENDTLVKDAITYGAVIVLMPLVLVMSVILQKGH